MDASVFPRPATMPEPPAPHAPRPSQEEAEAAVRTLIAWAGDDPAREGLRDTPRRVVRAYEELFSGYRQDVAALLEHAQVDGGGYDDLVLVRDIAFHAHCEHHMVPFFGKVHVAYFPAEKVVGLSKIPRLIDVFARRLQTQERLTKQIAEALDGALQARGVAVLIEAEHLCMTMRGVRKPGALTLTSQFTGAFRDDATEQARFFSLVRRGG